MKKADIKIGAVVVTRIGDELARVVVVRQHYDGQRWIVRREGDTVELPKARRSIALRPA